MDFGTLKPFSRRKEMDRQSGIIEDIIMISQSIKKLMDDLSAQRALLERKLMEGKMEMEAVNALSLRDPLTNLLNRRGLERALHRQMNLLQRQHAHCDDGHEPPEPSSLLFEPLLFVLDIDDFKRINDVRGHQFGDLAIKTIADILRSVFCRASDIICRFGGDEFVVLCSDVKGYPFFEGRLIGVLEELTFTVSVGVTTCSFEWEKLQNIRYIDRVYQEAFERADKALYASKEEVGNVITISIEE